MITSRKPISIAESLEYLEEKTEKNEELKNFIGKFEMIEEKSAKELRGKIEKLGLMKINGEQTAKIIDLMPENTEDLGKIFTDTALDENETKQILDAVREARQ